MDLSGRRFRLSFVRFWVWNLVSLGLDLGLVYGYGLKPKLKDPKKLSSKLKSKPIEPKETKFQTQIQTPKKPKENKFQTQI